MLGFNKFFKLIEFEKLNSHSMYCGKDKNSTMRHLAAVFNKVMITIKGLFRLVENYYFM